jgi:FKBP-type peptidyl-prolyl cis-trans isomerase
MQALRSGLVAASSLVLLVSCHHATPGDIKSTKFDPALHVELDSSTMLPSGVYYRDITVGGGQTVTTGDMVAVNYVGWLADGKQFDATPTGGPPFTFQLGAGSVIQGWDQGVAGMKVGGRRQLIIPPSLGYGAAGAGNGVIPPNAILVFVVDLVGVKNQE